MDIPSPTTHLADAYCGNEGVLCQSCGSDLVDKWTGEAEQFAEQNCKILGQLPRFDSVNVFAATPEGYNAGDREANTPNSYQARLRHQFTNYDELIKGLAKLASVRDSIHYDAIRARIEELLEAAVEKPENEDDSSLTEIDSDAETY